MGQCWTKLCGGQDPGDADASQHVNRSVHKITAKDKWEAKLSEAEKEGKIVVAAFTASWCAPCKEILPFYQELAGKYGNLSFCTIDVDELAEFSSSWDIKATPTFFFLKDGRQADKHVGSDRSDLERKVATISASLKVTPS
uniref:Thioredoxin domain-containing protein n=1 Tax=Kalanchoe fedtschenkoi TaxID=63787 RepID=A0A7N0UFD2_KALFE